MVRAAGYIDSRRRRMSAFADWRGKDKNGSKQP